MLAHCQGAIRHNWYLLRSSILCAFVGAVAVAVAVAGWQTSSSSSLSFSSSSSSFSSSYLWFEIAVASLVYLLYQVHSHLQGDLKNGSLRSDLVMRWRWRFTSRFFFFLLTVYTHTANGYSIKINHWLRILFANHIFCFFLHIQPIIFAVFICRKTGWIKVIDKNRDKSSWFRATSQKMSFLYHISFFSSL